MRDQPIGEAARPGDRLGDGGGPEQRRDELGVGLAFVRADELGGLVLVEAHLPGDHLAAGALDFGDQMLAHRGLVDEARLGRGEAADLDRAGAGVGVKRLEGAHRQVAVAHQEKDVRGAAGLRGEGLGLGADPVGEAAEDRPQHVMAERPCRLVPGAERDQRTVRLARGDGPTHPRVDEARGRALQPEPLRAFLVELAEMGGGDAERGWGDLVGGFIVADVEDRGWRRAKRFEDGAEQPLGLAQAVFRRAEDPVDRGGDFFTRRAGDQCAELGLAQIGVADDDDLKAARLGRLDQRDDRREGEAMARLGRELGGDRVSDRRFVRAGAKPAVDVLDRNLVAAVHQPRMLARGGLGASPWLDRAAGDVEIGEHVARRIAPAPDQRVEAVEREDADPGRRPVEQLRQFVRADSDLHSSPKAPAAMPAWLTAY